VTSKSHLRDKLYFRYARDCNLPESSGLADGKCKLFVEGLEKWAESAKCKEAHNVQEETIVVDVEELNERRIKNRNVERFELIQYLGFQHR